MSDKRPLILAIDDTPANLFTLGGALAAEFDLQIATSGERGFALAMESLPDLILLDVMMPDMDGYEVCRRFKAEPTLMHVPVIFLTALSDPASEIKGLSLGAADYIAKPIGVEIARQRIRNILEREQLRRALEVQLVERQKVQADLLESETRFRHFFEKSSSVMLLIDPASGAIKEANEAAVVYYGYPRTQLLGMSVSEINTLSPQAVAQEMQAARREERGHFLFRHRLASGEVRDVEVYSTPIRTAAQTVLFSIIHDITERKQVELALQQSHAALRGILDTTLDGYWRTDVQGQLLDVNPAYCWQSGYSREELLGMRIGDLDVHADQAFVAKRIQWLIDNGREIFETVHRRKDGSVWPVEVSTMYRDTEGGEIFVFMRDITARKQAEVDVARANNLLNEAIRSIAEGFTIYDEHDRLVVCNEAYLDFYSASRDLIVPGATFEEIVRKGAERGQYQDALGRIDEWVRERVSRHQAANGTHLEQLLGDGRWLLIIEDRTPSGYIVGNRIDITARKQAEAELERHRNRLEELVEERTAALLATEARASHLLQSSADGLYGVDGEGRITFINAAGCQMLGYRPEQVIGRSAHEAFHHSKPDGSPFPMAECLGHHAVVSGAEVRVDNEVYWHADGHAVPVMYAVHPMVLGDSHKGAVISFVDISAQRAAAEARERALLAAENLARVRSEFLSNMSHEIRTPLNGVLGFAQIGLRNADDGMKVRNAFEKILASGTRLLGVINDILDFSKIDAGKIRLDPVVVSLVDVMEQARELVGERASSKGLYFQTEYAPDLPAYCVIDELRLGQVLINLLSNAVKFTESGYVKLSAARQGNSLVFRVSDTGIGISDDQLALLFNPFQQADGSTTRRFGGTGLGLAICKRILELMGGDIQVESRPGLGSTFEFFVPFHPAPDALPAGSAQVAAEAVPSGRLGGLSILVAEDDEINQVIFEENLLEDGARVVIVGNGREALDRLRGDGCDAYDIVLMDVQMPEMDGYEATRGILAMAPELPVIGQTAHASIEEREKCLAAGMVAHIAKPIDPEALVELILKHVVPSGGR